MQISLIAAMAQNGIIGNGPDIPWQAKGEQLLFKALTFNQWLIVGRKTFAAMGPLPDRKFAVISRTPQVSQRADVRYFTAIDAALAHLQFETDHVIIGGGGEIYRATIARAAWIHLTTVHTDAVGDVRFPTLPATAREVFAQTFRSNVDYTYRIYRNVPE
jgi:dihydrofolate reductase (trimethoprim resistance protein)